MRTRTLLLALLTCTALSAPASNGIAGCIPAGDAVPALTLASDDTGHVVGQLIAFTITVANPSTAPLSMQGGAPGIGDGRLRLFVARAQGEFLEYRGPGWGMVDAIAPDRLLAPGDVLQTTTSVLFNQRVPTSHLTPAAAQLATRGRMPDFLAFAEPGTYRIEARLLGCDWTVQARSNALELTVATPTGSNGAAWKMLATDPDYFFFMHTGHPRADRGVRAGAEQASTLESILRDYSDSAYVPQIEASVARYRRATVAR